MRPLQIVPLRRIRTHESNCWVYLWVYRPNGFWRRDPLSQGTQIGERGYPEALGSDGGTDGGVAGYPPRRRKDGGVTSAVEAYLSRRRIPFTEVSVLEVVRIFESESEHSVQSDMSEPDGA